MRNAKYFGLAVLTAALVSMGIYRADDKKDDPKYTIKDVMKQAHTVEKGSKDPTLYEKVSGGKATKEEKAKLLELYSALPASKPPLGDADAWKDKTKAMIEATQAVVDGKEDAEKKLKAAVACMECHKTFRPPPKPKDK
jgi:hypothetical protein